MFTVDELSLNDPIDWNPLLNSCQTATIFQTKDWLQLWVKHFSRDKVKLLGVYAGENLIGIVPLYEEKKTIRFLGTSPVAGKELVSDFGDIIAKTSYEEIIWREVLTNLKTKRTEFNFIRDDSPSFKILRELGGKIEEVDVAPYIDLPKSWEDYLTSLNRHERHELKRKIRRIEEEGVIKVRFTGGFVETDEFFRLMALSSEEKKDFLSEKMQLFFREVINGFWKKNELYLDFLRLGDVNIASILLLKFNNQMLLYNSGYDPKFQRLAPGLILKTYAIKEAIEKGLKRFDFLRGGERYKYDLGGKERRLYKITFNFKN